MCSSDLGTIALVIELTRRPAHQAYYPFAAELEILEKYGDEIVRSLHRRVSPTVSLRPLPRRAGCSATRTRRSSRTRTCAKEKTGTAEEEVRRITSLRSLLTEPRRRRSGELPLARTEHARARGLVGRGANNVPGAGATKL